MCATSLCTRGALDSSSRGRSTAALAVMSTRLRHILWCVAQAVVSVVTLLAFFAFAPWLATRPISEAPPEAIRNLPSECPAFSVNHGTYICEWHDTIERNPVGFGLSAAVLALGLGFIYFTGFTGRGFSLRRHRKPMSSDA
jgi:hypothetical protein